MVAIGLRFRGPNTKRLHRTDYAKPPASSGNGESTKEREERTGMGDREGIGFRFWCPNNERPNRGIRETNGIIWKWRRERRDGIDGRDGVEG